MSEKINILIVENEVLISYMAESMLSELGYNVVGQAKNVDQALKILKTSKVGLVLLDINLSKGTEGIQLGYQLKETYHIPFIYLTSYSNKEIIDQAKQTNPGGYIIKPFNKVDLYTSIEICMTNVAKLMQDSDTKAKLEKPAFIELRTNRGFIRVAQNDILYIKADNVYVEIYTKEASYVERKSLKQIEEKLPQKDFVRIHRSYIINKNYITSWDSKQVYIHNIPVPLSKGYQKLFLELVQ